MLSLGWQEPLKGFNFKERGDKWSDNDRLDQNRIRSHIPEILKGSV